MRKASTVLLVATATLAGGWLVACGSSHNSGAPGPDASNDAPIVSSDGASQDAPVTADAGDAGDGSATSCGVDEAGITLSPFTCCVMGLIDNDTNATASPSPTFCNNLTDNTSDPGQFGKYF
jgi:hypothetical protein